MFSNDRLDDRCDSLLMMILTHAAKLTVFKLVESYCLVGVINVFHFIG